MVEPIDAARAQELRVKQAEVWSKGNFDPIAALVTIHAAPLLVEYAGIRRGEKVLDVATGTGVAALAAARAGGTVTGIDFAPPMIERARANAELAEVKDVSFRTGDAESLSFPDGSFDVVLSQFGHIFVPRPEVAAAEMVRVLRPGGRLALASWTPAGVLGRVTPLANKYFPPPPGVPGPELWGDPEVVRARLGRSVADLEFSKGEYFVRALSPRHYVEFMKANLGPTQRAFELLADDDPRRRAYERELLALYSEGADIGGARIRHEYLLARARKV